MAGESARELARKQREKAERLHRSAQMWERGAVGEQATADALSALPTEAWTAFHDVHWPGRRFANIDHLVVGPPGVFVIDSKNWTGRITVQDQVLRQNGRARESAVVGAAEAGLAVGTLVPLLSPALVHPVLCFVRDEPVSGWARDVRVCSTSTVVEMLLSRSPVLTREGVQQLTLDIGLHVRSATGPASPMPSPSTAARRTPAVRAAGRGAATTRRRGRPPGGRLARLAVVVVAGLALAANPQLLSGIGQAIGHAIADDVGQGTPQPQGGVKGKHEQRSVERP